MQGHRLPALVFAITAFLYVLVTPPFAAHDEANHFNKAVQYAQGHLFNIRQGDELGAVLPGWVDELEHEIFPVERPGALPTYRPADIARAWRHPFAPEPRFAGFSMIANYPPTLYLPQALGVATAEALGLPPLARFYAARLFNAALLVGLALTALRLMPVARPALMALLSFPVVAHQAGSCSADATVIGIAFVTLALVLRSALARGRSGVLLLPCVVLLTLAKGVYLPLTLAGLALEPRRATLGWLALSLGAGLLAFGAWTSLNSTNMVRQPLVDRVTHQHVLAALPQEQAAFLQEHPVFVARAVLTSFAERSPAYVVEAIGRFGWFSVMLPLPLYGLALALFAASLGHPRQPGGASAGQRLWWLALLFGGAMLIETALYLSATPLGAPFVQGTSGRYFIPLLPLLGMALHRPLPEASVLGRLILRFQAPGLAALMAAGLLVSLASFWRLGG